MTDFFNIWNPHLSISKTVIFDITPAEAELVCTGTEAFVSNCLKIMDLPTKFSRWTVKTVRQSYYSDYLHSQDWRARWDIAWILEVDVLSAVNAFDSVRVLPYRTSALDESAKGCDEPALSRGTALLVGSFLRQNKLEAEINDMILKWKKITGITAKFQLIFVPHIEGRTLVRCTIDFIKFPDDIDHLELLLKQWKQIGGLTNWQEVLASQRSPDAM